MFRVIRICFLAAAVSSIVAASISVANGDSESTAQKDGLLADVQAAPDLALVRWRFLRPLQNPLESITAEVDGVLLGTPMVQKYPGEGERTSVLVAIDPTGPERSASVTKQIAAAIVMSTRFPSHVQPIWSVYSQTLRILMPRDSDQLVAALALLQPGNEQPNLVSALTDGIEAVSSVPAQRRAIFIFSDGHSTQPIGRGSLSECRAPNCASVLADLAIKKGVSLNFIVSDSSRAKDLSVLGTLAELTGGQLVDEAHTMQFIEQPLTGIDTGGTALFPIPNRPHYFWQSPAKVTVTFVMGSSTLQLRTVVPQTSATVSQTLAYLWANYSLAMIMAGVLLILAVLLICYFVIFRRRKSDDDGEDTSASGAEPAPLQGESAARRAVLAVLQNIDDGTSHAISGDGVRIGRAAAVNDIVIDDQAVSREHAVLFRDENGAFVIANKGSNGTSVNHVPVEQAELAAGDLITIGDTTLRFVPTKA